MPLVAVSEEISQISKVSQIHTCAWGTRTGEQGEDHDMAIYGLKSMEDRRSHE